MLKLFSNILAALGLGAANVGSQACFVVLADEPECPKSLIK